MSRIRMPRLVIGVAVVWCLAACAAQPGAETPGPTRVAANVIAAETHRSAAAGPATPDLAAPTRDAAQVVASNSQVAQMIALWRAVTRGAVGQEVEWSSNVTADHGTTRILREVPIPESDRVCREYRQDAVAGGHAYRSLGQVCQQRDGTWAMISGRPALAPETPILETDRTCHSLRHFGSGGSSGSGRFCRQPDGSWAMVQG
jgi:surface antigen